MSSLCPGGGTGRRKGLKIPREQSCTSSSLVPGTNLKQLLDHCVEWLFFYAIFIHDHRYRAFPIDNEWSGSLCPASLLLFF